MRKEVKITPHFEIRPKQGFEIQNKDSSDGMQITEKRKRKHLSYTETKSPALISHKPGRVGWLLTCPHPKTLEKHYQPISPYPLGHAFPSFFYSR